MLASDAAAATYVRLAAEAAETHCSSQMRAIGMYVGSATKTLWFVGKNVSFGKPLFTMQQEMVTFGIMVVDH